MQRTISFHRNAAVIRRAVAYTARIHKGDAMKELMKELNSIKKYIPYNTFRTIKGQIKSGNVDAARTGIRSESVV